MSLIDKLSGKHLISVDIQPDGTYFCESLTLEEVEKLDEVLKSFKKLDALKVFTAIDCVKSHDQESLQIKVALRRLQKACELMETPFFASKIDSLAAKTK